ncbi:MAG: CRTAC1 family protein [Vicinamibacteria bacterium]|nr:CRTAC1 family protein [Vicinamibacteria bacterium]
MKTAGVRFVTEPCRTDHKHQPETMISGIALFDYDNDGLLDIFAVNGATMPGLDKTDPKYHNRLFRNLGDGRFTDVTAEAGVAGKSYELGAAAADYDDDGDVDLFVAGLRKNILYRNNGDGTFEDVTAHAGLAEGDPEHGTLWAVAAAFFDYDNDGQLDLFISNYCVWDPKTEPICNRIEAPDYCHPDGYEGLPNSLFHGNAGGTFTDVSAASGIRAHIGKGMGIGLADFDDDGWLDVFLSNDNWRAFLFHNRDGRRFEEIGLTSGVAYTELGDEISGMGADARDFDNDGRPDVFQTALDGETMPLFRNLGNMRFEDWTGVAGLAATTLANTGWSNGTVDFNNDGWKDLFVAGGAVVDPKGDFAARASRGNTVYMNLKNGRFADVSEMAGPEFAREAIHRGAAFADLDNDGRMDAVVTALEAPMEIWRNVSPAPNHWLLVKTIGSHGNRDGIGAKIRITTSSGMQWNHVNTAVGYGCASDHRVHFGLGRDPLVEELRIQWPSGAVQTIRDVPVDRILTIREDEATPSTKQG